MSFLGLAALSLPIIIVGMLLSAVPVWLAAKVVGAGKPGLVRAAVALVLATLLSVLLLKLIGPFGLLLWPVVFVVVFSRVMDTSLPGAFVLCVLALAIQVVVAKVLEKLMGGAPV